MWFLVDGARTMLVAGTRGSGKTSLLGALISEIMRKYRVITVEDTLELPVNYLRNVGYNIVQMKVGSAIGSTGGEMTASEGIRTTLRLGDSALIVGEVRSKEAISLYEAMRVGALALSVRDTNPSVRLYERAGFVVERTIINRVGSTSFTMRRPL